MKGDTAGRAWVISSTPVGEVLPRISGFTKLGAPAYLHDPKVEEFVERSSVEPDPAKRAALARALGQYFIDQRLDVPLFTYNGTWGLNSRVASWDNVQGGHSYLNRVETIVLKS